MTAIVEKIAIEVAATLALGAVTAFVFGLSATPEELRRRNRPRVCRRCGEASLDAAGEGQTDAVTEFRK